MQLLVKTLTGKTITLEISPECSIYELKNTINEKASIPVDQQRIIFNGKVLINHKTIKESTLENDSIIYLVLTLNGGNRYNYSKQSMICEHYLWKQEKQRAICITYEYFPYSGKLKYAATIFRRSYIGEQLTEKQIQNHEQTVKRRFEIRPIEIYIDSFLDYDDMLSTIRYEMCYGIGIKCPQLKSFEFCDDSGSEGSVVSEPESLIKYEEHITEKLLNMKHINRIKYYMCEYDSNKPQIQRDIFICFKGSSKSGNILYGACISNYNADSQNDIDAEKHYNTALARLNKAPIYMNIEKEFRSQIKKNAEHREDLMYHIVDNIFNRKNGFLQIKNYNNY